MYHLGANGSRYNRPIEIASKVRGVSVLKESENITSVTLRHSLFEQCMDSSMHHKNAMMTCLIQFLFFVVQMREDFKV